MGTAFPTTRKHVAVVRLLVATRQLVVFIRCLLDLGKSGDPEPTERRQFLILAIASAAKEAADVFRSADSEGCFSWIGDNPRLPDLANDIAAVRKATARDDPSSLFSRLLKAIRHNTGWHWNHNSIDTALNALADIRLEAFVGADRPRTQTVPLVRYVIAEAAWHNHPLEEIPGLLDELIAFHKHLVAVSHDQYFALVRLATESDGAV